MQNNLLANFAPGKLLRLLAINVFALATAFAFDTAVGKYSTTSWCQINPATPPTGKSFQIPSEKIHVVPVEHQMIAQEKLRSRTFLELSKTDAEQMLITPFRAASKNTLYLIRASAFYDNKDFEGHVQFGVSFYPKRGILEIANMSLSPPEATPKNLALIVEVPAKIKKLAVVCLTAT